MTSAFGIKTANSLCPDCDAEASLASQNGVPVLQVLHDDTCPILAQSQNRARS